MTKSGLQVSGFQEHVRGSRSDKGGRHRYPKQRRNWSCPRPNLGNLGLNDSPNIRESMTEFKNGPELREYWRVHKRQQRERQKGC